MHLKWESPTLIQDDAYTQLPNQMTYIHAILHVDKRRVVDHQPCSNHDMKS